MVGDTDNLGSTEYFGRAIKFFELYRDYFKHEDTIANQRTNAWLTMQGFLFASLGFAATGGQGLPHFAHGTLSYADFVRILVPIAGALTSIHMWIRDKLQTTTKKKVRETMAKFRSSLAEGPDHGFYTQQRYWLEHLPEWHFTAHEMAGGHWLRRLAFHKVLFAVWITILLLGVYPLVIALIVEKT